MNMTLWLCVTYHFQIITDKNQKLMAVAARKFEQIMRQVHEMKEQLLGLNYTFSPCMVNYYHIEQVQQLQQELSQTNQKLSQYQNHLTTARQTQKQQQKHLKKQNAQLLSINEQLVISNDKFKNMFQSVKAQKQELICQLQGEKGVRKGIEAKYQKQIENLKLIQAQELYILKKKQKKS